MMKFLNGITLFCFICAICISTRAICDEVKLTPSETARNSIITITLSVENISGDCLSVIVDSDAQAYLSLP